MSSDWCSTIFDSTRINELAIPGTHDASAWTHEWDDEDDAMPGTWAQRKNITEQLDIGVRVLDLRVGYASDNRWLGLFSFIGMFHGPIYLGFTLEEVLTDVNNWLEEHPKEFVILIFQQQGKFGQRDVSEAVGTLLEDTFGGKLFDFNPNSSRWPTVGELRGQVLVMGRLRSHVAGFCDVRSWLTDGDNTDGVLINAGTRLRIYLQDRYKELSGRGGWRSAFQGDFVSMADDNRKKFAKVTTAARANPGGIPERILKINHMSYSNLRYQPWESGEGVNTLLRNSMLKIQGVLMIDNADQKTVDYILSNNYRFVNSRASGFQVGRSWEI